jgi:hypothetical protein
MIDPTIHSTSPPRGRPARLRVLRRLVLVGLTLAGLGLCAAGAAADTLKVDFETGPPIGTPVTDDYLSSAFVFWQRSDPGFRPYRRVAGLGVSTQSGTVFADIGPDNCFPGEADNAGDCELVIPGTQADLTRTASAVTVYAGLSSAAGSAVSARLTAYNANNQELSSSAAAIGVGMTTPITVSSGGGDIARFDLVAEGPGAPGAELGFDDLTLEFPANSLPDISVAAPVNTVAVLRGGTTEAPVRVTRLNGSNGPVTFSVTGLPAGVTGTVSPDPLAATQADATLHLAATTNATPTPLQSATLTADPQGDANVAPAPRSAPFTVRVAAAFGLAPSSLDAMHLPQCAPVDRTFVLERDRSFAGTVQLSVEGAPAGVSAAVLPGAGVAPGGDFNVARTLRVSRGSATIPDDSTITVRARSAGFPDSTFEVPLDNAAPRASATPGFARTPRRETPGTTVRLDGNGFCAGTRVLVGQTPSGPNFAATAETAVSDDNRSLTFEVPRAGTSGPVTVVPPAADFYRTDNAIAVRSFRGEYGFAFANYHFSGLSLSEFTETAGADDLFIQINPCWPWGHCYVPTGILDPIAALEWPIFDAMLVGGDGHCYGMNRAVQELTAGKVPYNRFAAGVAVPFDLPDASGPKNGLGSYLDSRQATQLTAEALYKRLTRDPRLGVQLQRIEDEFAHGRHPAITLRHGAVGGHEVTAVDINRHPDGSLEIYTYDPNHPLTQAELDNFTKHLSAETDASAIEINAAHDHWKFRTNGGAEWSGGGDDGSLYSVPLSDIPDNPSLPGLTDLDLVVDIFGSTEGAAATDGQSQGARTEPLQDGGGNAGTDGIVVAGRGSALLSHKMTGRHAGSYSQLIAGPGFAGAVRDVPTAKGVVDRLAALPGRGRLSFSGGRNRPLDLQLAVDHGQVHRAASIETGASKGGKDTAWLGDGRLLTYEHAGGPAHASFSLTSVARNGGPVTFQSRRLAVDRGERLTLKPLDWHSLARVRLVSRRRGGGKTIRTLRNLAASGERFRVGRPKLVKQRAEVAVKILHVSTPAAGGVVLRLVRGRRTVARRAVAIEHPRRGRRIYRWRVPEVRAGSYRLVADVVLAGGIRQPARRSASRAAAVRIGRPRHRPVAENHPTR